MAELSAFMREYNESGPPLLAEAETAVRGTALTLKDSLDSWVGMYERLCTGIAGDSVALRRAVAAVDVTADLERFIVTNARDPDPDPETVHRFRAFAVAAPDADDVSEPADGPAASSGAAPGTPPAEGRAKKGGFGIRRFFKSSSKASAAAAAAAAAEGPKPATAEDALERAPSGEDPCGAGPLPEHATPAGGADDEHATPALGSADDAFSDFMLSLSYVDGGPEAMEDRVGDGGAGAAAPGAASSSNAPAAGSGVCTADGRLLATLRLHDGRMALARALKRQMPHATALQPDSFEAARRVLLAALDRSAEAPDAQAAAMLLQGSMAYYKEVTVAGPETAAEGDPEDDGLGESPEPTGRGAGRSCRVSLATEAARHAMCRGVPLWEEWFAVFLVSTDTHFDTEPAEWKALVRQAQTDIFSHEAEKVCERLTSFLQMMQSMCIGADMTTQVLRHLGNKYILSEDEKQRVSRGLGLS